MNEHDPGPDPDAVSDERPAEAAERDDDRRTLTMEQRVEASPEDVWEALTTGPGLERWFPLAAEVEPGESIWLSWGPGCEGRAPIRVWDPPRRLGWTESYGDDENGRPIEVAVDFIVESRRGQTVVRLVHSGFSASADWDEMFDATRDGWRYFLFNLGFYFRRHAGRDRTLVWRRHPTGLDREEAWARLEAEGLVHGEGSDAPVRLGGERRARTVSARPSHHYAAVLPGLGDALWFVELEGRHVGFWLSLYDTRSADVEVLQATLDARAGAALG